VKAAGFPDAAEVLQLAVTGIELKAEIASISLRYAEPCRSRQNAR
jgi:hypothetical protein